MTDPQLALLRQAALGAPDNINKWLDLCEHAEKIFDYPEIVRAADELARLAPGRPQPHFIRALALQHMDRLEEAVAAYRQAVACDADYIDGWINLGACCQALNLLPEAEQACRRAIAASGQDIADDDLPNAAEDALGRPHWNLAILELLQGDYRRGFARYPARFKALGRKRPTVAQPLWRGEDLRGKTILINADQGHGDTLMLARYLPLLRQRGARVILQAQPALLPLLKDWPGIDGILEAGRDAFPVCDYHASEFDLPRFFGTELQTIPATVPYLPTPAPDEATRLPENGKLKVGLTWAGYAKHPNDKNRSLRLKDLAPLLNIGNIDFYAINRDKRDGDDALLAALPVTDLTPRLPDFLATARFVNQMGVVISCDTSIAHLAGGMGKRVWVMLPFAPSWCWMMEREDSLWYPTARLFRQKRRGEWDEVVQRMSAALAKL